MTSSEEQRLLKHRKKWAAVKSDMSCDLRVRISRCICEFSILKLQMTRSWNTYWYVSAYSGLVILRSTNICCIALINPACEYEGNLAFEFNTSNKVSAFLAVYLSLCSFEQLCYCSIQDDIWKEESKQTKCVQIFNRISIHCRLFPLILFLFCSFLLLNNGNRITFVA